MKRAFRIGGSAPKPPGFTAFFPPEWLNEGAALPPPGAIPAAETVARVASQHCPIPSGSGTISLQQVFSAGYEKPANGNLSLISVSQARGSVQTERSPGFGERSVGENQVNVPSVPRFPQVSQDARDGSG